MQKPDEPNEMNWDSRLICLVIATGLIAYGIHGLWINDLYLPGKGGGHHLQGGAAWLLFSAMTCLALFFISFLVGHYSAAFHKRYGRLSRKLLGWAAAVLFFATIALVIWQMYLQLSCCSHSQNSSTMADQG